MNKLLFLAFLLVLASCTPRISVLVIEDLENGFYHVATTQNNYSDVIKLPPGTQEGDIIKIKPVNYEENISKNGRKANR